MPFGDIFGAFYNIFGLILLLVGVFIFAVGFYGFKRKRLIENTPTSKIRSLAMGLVEIYGDVIPAQGKTLVSPLTQKNCVYYHYLVERYEEHYNSSTKKTEGRWVTVQNEKHSIPFDLQDETGMVLVDPNQASIQISKNYETRQGNMRYTEWYIEPNEKLYILGTAGENPNRIEDSASHVENIMIQKGREEKQYLISDKSEKQLLKSLSIMMYVPWCIGIVLIVAGVIILLRLI